MSQSGSRRRSCGGSPGSSSWRVAASRPALRRPLPPRLAWGSTARSYASARAEFRTTLTRRGPSPQPEGFPATPEGASRLSYTSAGRELSAFVSADPGDGVRRPAVLFLHGGFAFGGGDWAMSSPFREADYVVMTPILRGENGQGGDFSLFHDELDDVLAAADCLTRLAYVDPHRLFVAGHSAGGTLTLLAALSSSRFRAAAAFSGSPDQAVYIQNRPEIVPFDGTSTSRSYGCDRLLRSPAASDARPGSITAPTNSGSRAAAR